MPKLTKEQLKQIEDYIKSVPEEEREEKLKEITSQMEQEPQCPFCLMSENKIQTTKIYEDENFLSVLEIQPANEGHSIIFPKRHIKSISELNEQETETITKVIKKITKSLSQFSEGITIVESEGEITGQRFDHLVINIIPRVKKDSITIEWQAKKVKPEDLEKTQREILENYPVEKPKPQPIDEDKVKGEFSKIKKRLP